MTVFPQLAILTTAAFFGLSGGNHHAIDFKMTSPDGVQRLDQLWLVTSVDEAGREIVVQAKLTNGEHAPMIAADAARLESMMPAARGLATANNI